MALKSSLDVFTIILLFITNKEKAFKNNKILLATIIVFIIFSFSNILLNSSLILLKDKIKV